MLRINVTLGPTGATIFAVGKAISITASECVLVALVIQHTKRMRLFILSSSASLAAPYLSTLSHKGTILVKVTEHKLRLLIFSAN
jgi:hypothetical protein